MSWKKGISPRPHDIVVCIYNMIGVYLYIGRGLFCSLFFVILLKYNNLKYLYLALLFHDDRGALIYTSSISIIFNGA